jgi:hypothetical protein
VARHPAAMQVHQFGRGLIANALSPAADMNFGAEAEEARGHRFAKTGSATGDQNASAGKKLFVKHGGFRPKEMSVNWLID